MGRVLSPYRVGNHSAQSRKLWRQIMEERRESCRPAARPAPPFDVKTLRGRHRGEGRFPVNVHRDHLSTLSSVLEAATDSFLQENAHQLGVALEELWSKGPREDDKAAHTTEPSRKHARDDEPPADKGEERLTFKEIFYQSQRHLKKGKYRAVDVEEPVPLAPIDWSVIPFPALPLEHSPNEEPKAALERARPRLASGITALKHPQRSPFCVYPAEDVYNGRPTPGVDNEFLKTFRRQLGVSSTYKPIETVLETPLPTDLWHMVLDLIDAPSDLFSIAQTSSVFYRMAMPRLYRSIAVSSPRKLSSSAEGKSGLICFARFLDQTPLPTGSRQLRKTDLARYVRHLSIERWHSALDPGSAVTAGHQRGSLDQDAAGEASFMILPPRSNQLEIWKGYYKSDILQLWVRMPGQDEPSWLLNTLLARFLAGRLPQLESFSYHPQRHTPVDFPMHSPTLRTIHSRGYIEIPYLPVLTGEVLQTLKQSAPHLKKLSLDFDGCDPLVRERNKAITGSSILPPPKLPAAPPEEVEYDPRSDGLVGFQGLAKLEILGVGTHDRFSEIRKVVADCLLPRDNSKEGTLRRFVLGMERWRYLDIQYRRSVNPVDSLLVWFKRQWDSCFSLAESRRADLQKTAHHVHVTIMMQPYVCELTTSPFDYMFDVSRFTSLSLHCGPFRQIQGLLTILSREETPYLQKLCVEAELENVYRFLRRHRGLRELYVFQPGLYDYGKNRDFWNFYVRPISQHDREEIRERYEKPRLADGLYFMDEVCKSHLRTLEVLVVEALLPVPIDYETSGRLNHLRTWKERGHNLKGLGMNFYGSTPHVQAFVRCFPKLSELWCFDTQDQTGLQMSSFAEVGGMPRWLQYSLRDLFEIGLGYCKASNDAAILGQALAQEVVEGAWGNATGLPKERWIAAGRNLDGCNDWRWKWKEEEAGLYCNWCDADGKRHYWSKRMDEYGGHSGRGNKTRAWEKDGVMFRTLREHFELYEALDKIHGRPRGIVCELSG